MSEYIEPLSRFRREQIQDTVVFFGSARVASGDSAANNLSDVRSNGAGVAAAQQALDVKRAEAAVDMARYYEDARRLAYLLTEWSATHSGTAAAVCRDHRGRPGHHGSGQPGSA